MKHTVFLFLLFTFNLYSQDLDCIKQNEVLFVLHSGINGNYQSKRISQKSKKQRARIYYNFFFTDESSNSLQNEKVTFTYHHYYDFDEKAKDNPVPYFKVNKSFLRKNKKIIITGEFMQEIGYKEAVNLINNVKTIFLIDKTEILGKEIIIKEVKYWHIAEE